MISIFQVMYISIIKEKIMKLNLFSILLLAIITSFACNSTDTKSTEIKGVAQVSEKNDLGPVTLVIHGGAGTITRVQMSPEKEKAYREKLEEALNVGYSVLEKGGTSMDAVVATIQVMEMSPLFNAGVGAVFTSEGKNELDASIMDGKSGLAGSVAGVTNIKSPINAARAVMEKSEHVMLAGPGAERFAEEQGLEIVDSEYFFTERRYNQLKSIKEVVASQGATSYLYEWPDRKYGTVGAVALDKYGNIAAGTSTGGMTNKRYGRIGDAPIIGAGTYADNATCGVSATGHGEFFIRNVVAYDISALMKYRNLSLNDAAEEVVNNKLVKINGSGGIVSLDRQGNVAMKFNSEGMYRGFKKEGQTAKVFIYKDE